MFNVRKIDDNRFPGVWETWSRYAGLPEMHKYYQEMVKRTRKEAREKAKKRKKKNKMLEKEEICNSSVSFLA